MSKAGNNPDGQDDVDAIFDELVADLRAEGFGTKSDGADAPRPQARREEREEDEPAPRQPSDWRSGDVGWDETMLSDDPAAEDTADEHFVPPEPPPLPRPTRAMAVVALFFGIGLVLLIVPSVIGMSPIVATPLGILALAAGLGFLLLRARDDNRPPGSDPSNGAQV